jgi:hydrogenase/urease accessory protein HupE
VVFPARLELLESQPGLFDVQFNLPVQNQARVKATPVLPSVCVAIEPPEVSFTEAAYKAVWQVRCSADALPGQTIAVDGLLGSQTDVLLSIKTMDGRQYNAVLKPARAMYVIPKPPSLIQLIGKPLVDGIRGCFVRVDLYLLIWLVVLFARRRREAIVALMLGGLAYAVAQAFAGENLLLLPAGLPAVVILLVGLTLANRLANGSDVEQRPRFPAWVIGGFVGALYGAALQGIQTAPEFSRLEQRTAFIATIAGVMTGLFVLLLLCVEFRQILRMTKGLRHDARERRILGTLTGIVALGLLIYQLSAYSLLPALVPTAPPIFLIMAVVLGLYFGQAETGSLLRWLAPTLLLVVGLVTGALGYDLPYDGVVVPLVLFALGIGLVTKRELPRKAAVVILALAALYSAAQTSVLIQGNLSKPIAHMAGNSILAGLLFLAGSSFAGRQDARFSPGIRLAGAMGSVVALLVWGQGYASWLHTTFIADYAMGFIRIPLLSLVLVLMAAAAWPRRSRVAAQLNVDTRKQIGHIVLLVLAVFLLNVGTIQAQNPMFEQDAPGSAQARRILEVVLTNTYSAFNLKDEEQLYKQLSESVGDDLVEDLYLDSRRRLTSGVRQGSEVTVKNVRVLNVGAPLKDAGSSDDFAYHCEWVVTARVRHLQHVHHRKNMYTGILKIRADDGQWKIQQVDLESEDRTVVPGRSI